MKKEKIPKDFIKIQEVHKKLKEIGSVKISYRGLRHYLNIGLIPKPIKLEGHKEKYYDLYKINSRIIAIQDCSSLFNLNHDNLRRLFSGNPDIIDMLPATFILSYAECIKKTKGCKHYIFRNLLMLRVATTLFIESLLIAIDSKQARSKKWGNDKIIEEMKKIFIKIWKREEKKILKGL